MSSCVPAALLTALEEDDLDVEERIQRCQADARQYLQVKPEIAWSRAQQAVTLLGRLDLLAAVTDKATRDAAYLTLAEVCFALGLQTQGSCPNSDGRTCSRRRTRPHPGAQRIGLASMIDAVGRVHRAVTESRLQTLVELVRILPRKKGEIEPWLRVEHAAWFKAWIDELESAIFNGHNAAVLVSMLPPFYEALDIPDREARSQRIRQRGIQLLIKDGQYASALALVQALTERQPKLEAVCREGMGDFRAAAGCHQAAGNLKDALNCYRTIPDLDAAVKMIKAIGDHPAAASLEWIARLPRIRGGAPGEVHQSSHVCGKENVGGNVGTGAWGQPAQASRTKYG